MEPMSEGLHKSYLRVFDLRTQDLRINKRNVKKRVGLSETVHQTVRHVRVFEKGSLTSWRLTKIVEVKRSTPQLSQRKTHSSPY